MKTMKYIVTTIALTIAMSINAQFAEMPQTGFQSTSTMEGTGSYLPSAAESGVMMAETPASSNGRIARTATRPPSQDEPFADPIGEGLWVMMVMAAGYAASVAGRRRRGENC